MNQVFFRYMLVILLFFSLPVLSRDKECKKNSEIQQILSNLNGSVSDVVTLEGEVIHVVKQPLFESKTTRKGKLFYKKNDETPKLRINFETLQQDEDKPQDYREEYLFSGKWLTHINYRVEEVKKIELTDSNEPVDPLELARENFPILGLSEGEEFSEDFVISMKKTDKKIKELECLELEVKDNNRFSEKYDSIDFWIDKNKWLPSRITAYTTEEEIYELIFNELKVNEEIEKGIFEIDIPDKFGEPEIINYEDRVNN